MFQINVILTNFTFIVFRKTDNVELNFECKTCVISTDTKQNSILLCYHYIHLRFNIIIASLGFLNEGYKIVPYKQA